LATHCNFAVPRLGLLNRITMEIKKDHFHVLSTVTALAQPCGTV